jgi:hypothetical protein
VVLFATTHLTDWRFSKPDISHLTDFQKGRNPKVLQVGKSRGYKARETGLRLKTSKTKRVTRRLQRALQPNDILANFVENKAPHPPLVTAHTLMPPSAQQGEEALEEKGTTDQRGD